MNPLAPDEIEAQQLSLIRLGLASVQDAMRVEDGGVRDRPVGVSSSRWEPSQSGMSQPSSADRTEQPLTPDTQVTTSVGITLTSLSTFPSSTFARYGSGIFWLSEFRHSEYVSTDTVRPGDVQRGPGQRAGSQRRRRQRRASVRRAAVPECPCHRRAGQRLTDIRSSLRRVAQPERRRGHPARVRHLRRSSTETKSWTSSTGCECRRS